MNRFKSIMWPGHTQKKQYLHHLFTDRQVHNSSLNSYDQYVEDEKVFDYRKVSFEFEGTGYRTMEKLVMYVNVPSEELYLGEEIAPKAIAYEDYLLRKLSQAMNELCLSYQNDHKSSREKPHFSMQTVTSVVQRRNGCYYQKERESFRFRIHFKVPLINEIYLNAKSFIRTVKDMLELICDTLGTLDKEELREHIALYGQQQEIREFLKEKGYVAFVGNNSILPRQGETELPMMGAIPFQSPKEMEIQIPLKDGSVISGMGIKRGVTVITGGGYSGKSTLLDALEAGIYPHIKDDGREYVVTDISACKIYAEDGRFVKDVNIAPFFGHMPGGAKVECFSTARASGSVSQATGIIEAVYGGSKLLMIDEDTSATNFMIRDNKMRRLVEKEPIIPFTDRVRELSDMGISTVLVIGGSSEYLKYADTVLLMEDYEAKDKTDLVGKMLQEEPDGFVVVPVEKSHNWTNKKRLHTMMNQREFFYCESVQIENARYIKIDEYVADITKLTAMISDDQINSLTYMLEGLLGEKDTEKDLYERCMQQVESLFENTKSTILSFSHKYELWLESVRPIDLLMTVCRLRV
ncbi:MAG: hypothetical protein IKK33_08725 [Lachnospiraceae bacterium]|nr:hypothetical protein [Lachnospiraceae bacterium]